MVPTELLLRAGVPLHAVFVCLNDQSANLALALDIEQRLGDETTVLVPAMEAAETLGSLLQGVGRIRPVLLRDDADAFDLLHDHMRDTVAHEAHDAYLASRAHAPDFGERPSDRPWSALGAAGRHASRAYADGMIDQLRATWYEIEILYDWDAVPAELSASAIEAMAQLEHLRWMAATRAVGYQLGTHRDDTRRIHDLLVPWVDLPEDARQIDREMVRRRPRMLSDAGFSVRHDPVREALARRYHERYLDSQVAAGGSSAALLPWSALSETQRALNRSAIDHISLKLATICCRAVPLALVDHGPATLSATDVETMAKLEHERWCDERWRQGCDRRAARRRRADAPVARLMGGAA